MKFDDSVSQSSIASLTSGTEASLVVVISSLNDSAASETFAIHSVSSSFSTPTAARLYSVGSIVLKNQFVWSATWEGMYKGDGTVTEKLVKHYSDLTKGQVGLIVTGIACVNSMGKVATGQMGIDNDELIPSMRSLVENVNNLGGRIVIQLASSEYLSPYFNKRTDCYDGSLENRAKLALDIFDQIRPAVGEDFPVVAKINCEDFREPGLKIDDCIYVCKELSKRGIDAIEVSGGTPLNTPDWIKGGFPVKTGVKTVEQEAYFYPYAKKLGISLEGKVPLILVVGLRSIEVIEKILHEGAVDYFALARPLIYEPDLVKRWKSGDRPKSKCTSCNECIMEARTGSLRCSVKARQEKKIRVRSESEECTKKC